MKKRLFGAAIILVCAAVLTSCATTEQQQPAEPAQAKQAAAAKESAPSKLNVERSNVTSTVATVEAVDLKARMVKLRSLEGRLFTVHVGKEAVNLPQVRVGDKVEIMYAQSLEVRMAEPGEVRNETGTIVGRAEPGAKPAGVGITETNITATILDLDKVNETATLKMADGTVAAVKVQNPANLDKVKVGDTIAIKYIEALEIKVQGKKR